MAAIAVSVFEPTPGKAQEALSLVKEAQEIITGLGSRVQVGALVRGGVPGQLSVIVENDDSATYGAALDRMYADSGFQKFVARAQAKQAMTPIRSVDYVEIPGFELAPSAVASAGVLMASMFVIREGKQEESLSRIKTWKELTEQHGAKTRALQAVVSEPFGVTATVAYYDNFTQWGKFGKALNADKDWQKFAAELRGKNASADFLRTALIRVV